MRVPLRPALAGLIAAAALASPLAHAVVSERIVAVVGDRVHEEAETFVVELFDAVGATLLDERAEITIIDDDEDETSLHGIVLAVGSAHGNAGSRFGTAVQMVNFSDEPAAGMLRFIPAGTTDAGTSIPYSLAPREMRVFDDLLPELGLGGLATLDVIASSGPLPPAAKV